MKTIKSFWMLFNARLSHHRYGGAVFRTTRTAVFPAEPLRPERRKRGHRLGLILLPRASSLSPPHSPVPAPASLPRRSEVTHGWAASHDMASSSFDAVRQSLARPQPWQNSHQRPSVARMGERPSAFRAQSPHRVDICRSTCRWPKENRATGRARAAHRPGLHLPQPHDSTGSSHSAR